MLVMPVAASLAGLGFLSSPLSGVLVAVHF